MALILPLAPAQIVSFFMVTVGLGVIKTDLLATAMHPVWVESFSVIKYVPGDE
jgi:hypothetical protein